MRVALSGRSAATAATINAVGAALWNPHASIRLRVYEISWAKTVATVDNMALVRTTTRGTVTTIASTVDNETDRAAVAPSGAGLDVTYTAQPTIASAAAPLARWNLPAAIGAGFVWSLPEEWEIPPGTGLAIMTPVATILQPADVSFRWAE